MLALPAEGAVSHGTDHRPFLEDGAPTGVWRGRPPPGRWIIYRFGHTTTGALIQPAPWKATGLECDKMNPEAEAFHMNHILGELKKHCADVLGHGLDFLWFDSYEAGTPELDAADARGIPGAAGLRPDAVSGDVRQAGSWAVRWKPTGSKEILTAR